MLRALLLIGIFVNCSACSNSAGNAVVANNDTTSHSSASSPVLIELFTSQGCSSCPAADRLIGNIITTGTNVIALAYHVDYWDQLGWKDVFSNHDFTIRQQQYVQALHAESPYTPQAVVQGAYEMVGSNRTRIVDAIGKAKTQLTKQTITAAATANENIVKITYVLSPAQPKQQIVIALVQNKVTTSVARGENAGARLTEYNVVRNFYIQPARDNGTQEMTIPDDLKKEDASIVLFTQDEATKKVATVTQIHL